ncbi:MAG: DUF3795 domain-containing protein [Ruminococcus sp.]|nr:DUF3795 domain-containing protein [Ruminococcus sp.]
MSTLCGANCDGCSFSKNCRGCESTCGRPFGGTCVAAEYIKVGGREKYAEFKHILLQEVNDILKANGIPAAEGLCELPGSFVNLAYPLPNGTAAKFLDDTKVYLGTQVQPGDIACFGVVADTTFILVCSYGVDGSEPELVAYRKR